MPTSKPRIFITLPEAPYGQLRKLARAREESLSRIAAEFIQAGMNALEDEWLSELGDARLTRFPPRKAVSFETVKKLYPAKRRGPQR